MCVYEKREKEKERLCVCDVGERERECVRVGKGRIFLSLFHFRKI